MSEPPILRAFEPLGKSISLAKVVETRRYAPAVRASRKYEQIAASIRAVGLVEPLVVTPEPQGDAYLLLDGHLRLMVLRDQKVEVATCLISRDDESFSYNKRISRLTAAQEHRMILSAVERGVSEPMLAEALGLGLRAVRRRAKLLSQIDPSAAEILSRDCPSGVFEFLQRLTPRRQIEVASIMVEHEKLTVAFARALWAASRPEDVRPGRRLRRGEVTAPRVQKMREELASLEAQIKELDGAFGCEALHLTLARGHVARLLSSERLTTWIRARRPEYMAEFAVIAQESPDPAEALPTDRAGRGDRRGSPDGATSAD